MEKIQNKVFASAKEGTLFVANQIKNLGNSKFKYPQVKTKKTGRDVKGALLFDYRLHKS